MSRARAPRRAPTSQREVIGRRAEGVLRFPEAVAVDPQGDVFVADQLSYVVQKFNAEGTLVAEWGSYGGGHGQFGPIGGLAADVAGNVYVVDSSHNRIEKFDANGNFLTAWGHRGSELGQFNFGSSQDFTHPPGGGIAVAGNYVYVADSGNNRIERFNLEGGEALQWGSYGGGPGQFAYPRGVAANESEVIVSDDNYRVQRFDPAGDYQASAGSRGTGPGQFGFTYGVALDAAGDVYVADDLNHRVVKLGTAARLHRGVGRVRVQTRAARVPARAGERPGRRHLRRRHRQRPHPGVRPQRQLPAHPRLLRAAAPVS